MTHVSSLSASPATAVAQSRKHRPNLVNSTVRFLLDGFFLMANVGGKSSVVELSMSVSRSSLSQLIVIIYSNRHGLFLSLPVLKSKPAMQVLDKTPSYFHRFEVKIIF